MAITFVLDATKLAEGANAPKDVVAHDLKVDLFRRPVPTTAPLPGRPRLHLAVAPIASTPPAPPATSLAATPVRLGLAPLLAPPAVPLAPLATRVGAPTRAEEEDKEPVKSDTSGSSESFSGVVSAAIFGVYAILRLLVVKDGARTEQALATAVAFLTFLTFLASILFGEGRDTLAGITLGVGTLADIAVATNGFDAVPIIALVDQPVAVAAATTFFLWRRARSDMPMEPHEHRDLQHQATNETVTLLVAVSYFMIVPAFDMTLGAAVSVLTLQVAASALLLFGSLPAQCIGLSSHTIALLVATLSATAREIALNS